MIAAADTMAPLSVPSFGVTSTVIVSPLLPLPATLRSKVSVRLLDPAVVFFVPPLTLHAEVGVAASPSASAFVAVAVTVSFVLGLLVLRLTVAVGALFTTVAVAEATAPSTVPSFEIGRAHV